LRDMSQVLERWAGWARSDESGIDYSPIAAGFKGLLPQNSKMNLSCTDDDGLAIESCLVRLRRMRPEEHDLVILYYFYRISKRSIAKRFKCDEKMIRIKLQMAEGFIEGCLTMAEINLSFD